MDDTDKTSMAAEFRALVEKREKAEALVIEMLHSGEIKLNGAWAAPTTQTTIDALGAIGEGLRSSKGNVEFKLPAKTLKKYRNSLR